MNLGVGGYGTNEERLLSSEFDLFTPQQYYKDVVKTIPLIVRPQAQGGQNNIPYQLEVPFDPDKWTDLSSARLHGRAKIFNKTKNAAPAATENWSTANNFYHALFSKPVVKINGTEISDPSSNPYPYKSFFECLMNYSKEFKLTVLKSSHWIEDKPYKTARVLQETTNGTKNAKFNQAYVDRREGLSGGAYNEFNIPLLSDIITCKKFLPPGYTIEITLTRMPDSFALIVGEGNNDDYTIELDNIHLSLDRYEVSDEVQQAYNKGLKSTITPTIPITRNYIKAYPKSQGETDLGTYNLFMGKVLPEAIYVAFVDQTAYNGAKTENPFYLKNIPLLEASLIVNSYNEPSTPYTNTNESKKKMDLYHEFLRNTGGNHLESQSVCVTYDMYYGG